MIDVLKGVLFDLGDTLQQFRTQDWAAINRAQSIGLYEYLAERGQSDKLPPVDAFIELMAQRMAAQSARRGSMFALLDPLFAEQGITDVSSADCLLPWYGYVKDLAYLRPDVVPTLRLLRAGGLKLGLISNTVWPADAHDPDLERFGIKDMLECRLYSCDVGIDKPDPRIFQQALACLDLPAGEVAFVGDFLKTDIAGAHGLGMKGVWVRVADRPAEVDDHTVVPDGTISTIGELPAVLHQLYGWEAGA